MSVYQKINEDSAINAVANRFNAYDAEITLENEEGKRCYLHMSEVFDTEYTISEESLMEAIKSRPSTDMLNELFPIYLASKDSIPLLELYKVREEMGENEFSPYFDRLEEMIQELKDYVEN